MSGDLGQVSVPLSLVCKKHETNRGFGEVTPEATEQSPSVGLAGAVVARRGMLLGSGAQPRLCTTLLCVLAQSLVLSAPQFSHWSSEDSQRSDGLKLRNHLLM